MVLCPVNSNKNPSSVSMSGMEITIHHYPTDRACEENERKQQCNIARKRKEDNSWLDVVPAQIVKVRKCDEIPDEFIRAGIGLCFEGRHKPLFTIVMYKCTLLTQTQT